MITTAIERIRTAVVKEYPLVASLGIYNRRYKRRRKEWSQHAWGNAWDITYPSSMDKTEGRAYLDRVFTFLVASRATKALPIHYIIWRAKDHYDHIHVVGEPKRTGTPPLPKRSKTVDTAALMIQRALNIESYTDDKGRALEEDGIAGELTLQAFTQFMRKETDLSGVTFRGTIN